MRTDAFVEFDTDSESLEDLEGFKMLFCFDEEEGDDGDEDPTKHVADDNVDLGDVSDEDVNKKESSKSKKEEKKLIRYQIGESGKGYWRRKMRTLSNTK